MMGSRNGRSKSIAGAVVLALVAMTFTPSPAKAAPGTTSRVSVASDGTQGNSESDSAPAISADGRFVAFQSQASNLVPGDTNNQPDTFVHDRQTASTTRVSVADSNGAQANSGTTGAPSISADGRLVAFASFATNLVVGDVNGQLDVFVRDRVANTTVLVSKATDGTQGSSQSSDPAINATGRYVAFATLATNLVAGTPGDTNRTSDVLVHDLTTGTTTLVSGSATFSGQPSAGGGGEAPAITADGRYVAFESFAKDLIRPDADPTEDRKDIFVRDLQTNTTREVTGETSHHIFSPDISDDGRYVVYSQDISNLRDVFLKDLQLGNAAIRITNADRQSGDPVISGDGRYVAYARSHETGTPGIGPSVFVYDRQTATTERLTDVPDSSSTPRGDVSRPAIDAQGLRVAFHSDASLVPGDTNGVGDTFVNDRKVPLTVSIGDATVQEGDAGTRAVFIVTLSKASTSWVYVNYATVKGTAVGTDFTAKSGKLSFSPGTTSLNVKVAITPDTLVEGTETFSVKLSAPSGATIADGIGVGTIIDND